MVEQIANTHLGSGRVNHADNKNVDKSRYSAFDIADTIVVTTVQNGERTKASLCRRDLEKISCDLEMEVEIIKEKGATSESNGTIVELQRHSQLQIKQKTGHQKK